MKAYQYFSLTLSLSILYTAYYISLSLNWLRISLSHCFLYGCWCQIIHPQNSSSKSFNDYHRCVLSLIDLLHLLHSIPANIMFYFFDDFFSFPFIFVFADFFFNFFFMWIVFCFTRVGSVDRLLWNLFH